MVVRDQRGERRRKPKPLNKGIPRFNQTNAQIILVYAGFGWIANGLCINWFMTVEPLPISDIILCFRVFDFNVYLLPIHSLLLL